MVRHCNSDVLEGELVSVLMPVYNGERYLDQAVKSIINQTYKNIEIVIIDDGSFDRSIEIIKYYMSLDGRVKAYFLPHSGLVAALNYGLVKCKGDFVVRMDADDIALPNRVERLFSCIVRSQLLVVGSAVSLMDESGKRLRDGNVPVGVEKVKNRLRHSSCIFHPTVIFRRESVLSAGGYRSQFKAAEDYDLWLRLAEKGGLNNISDVLLLYRVHASSVSAQKIESQALSSAAALAAFYIRNNGDDENSFLQRMSQSDGVETLISCCPREIRGCVRRSYYRSIVYGARFPDEMVGQIYTRLTKDEDYIGGWQDSIDYASTLLRLALIMLRRKRYWRSIRLFVGTITHFPVGSLISLLRGY